MTNRKEIDVYARRLLSHDRLSPKEIELYVTRRRQALLFFATQTDPRFRVWKDAHPDEARFCTEAGWASIPMRELSTRANVAESVTHRANAARILAWWDEPDIRNAESVSPQTRRLKLVEHPNELKRCSAKNRDGSGAISCLSMDDCRILAAPCPVSGEYHFLSDIFLIESLTSEHSQREEQYVTDLDSRTELFIRRRLPFKLDFKTEGCACGRPFPLLDLEP